jgi:hypothetical protein
LPTFHREVSSIVREQVSPENGTLQSDTCPIREPALERDPDHVRKILRDSLPSQDVSRHLLEMFLDYQNSIFYVCSREEAQSQLALMYEDPAQVGISWFCQMFLIFAVGVQFDDIYETDGATYHEIGQKYIDDAIDENPQSTIWVIRAMLLLCIYQPPTKWNSVWMHLGNAIARSKVLDATELTIDRCRHSRSPEISARYGTKSSERSIRRRVSGMATAMVNCNIL